MPRIPSMSLEAIEKRAIMSESKSPPTVANLKKRPALSERLNSKKQRSKITEPV
jgi:hypothetical protein